MSSFFERYTFEVADPAVITTRCAHGHPVSARLGQGGDWGLASEDWRREHLVDALLDHDENGCTPTALVGEVRYPPAQDDLLGTGGRPSLTLTGADGRSWLTLWSQDGHERVVAETQGSGTCLPIPMARASLALLRDALVAADLCPASTATTDPSPLGRS